MKVIPAIDLKDGRCVRLLQGREEDSTVYSDDPAAMAGKWAGMGAELIHVVDLDGAFTGSQTNIDSIRAIRAAVDVALEVGGGIRGMDKIDELLALGVDRVILGTVAAENPGLVKRATDKYPGKVLAGIDARDGVVAIKGWIETTEYEANGFARVMASLGVAGIIYTDISRDGMLTGPNIKAMAEMVLEVDVPVIASGGISTIEDIKALMAIDGLWGAITGKAIYSGSLELAQAIALAGGNAGGKAGGKAGGRGVGKGG